MIKTQILLRKTIEGNRRLGLGLGLGLVFFCFILNSVPLTRNTLQTLPGRQKYEEEMSDEQCHALSQIFFSL